MTRRPAVLVVDDDRKTVDLVRLYLERAGYGVSVAYDGSQALELVRERPPDLVVLDLMLPHVHGLDVCHLLRQDPAAASLPIIILTARTTEADKLVGLETGADDYVTKPFSPRELVARVRAVLRRVGGGEEAAAEPVTRLGSLEVDHAQHEARVDGKPVRLTPREFRILQALARAGGRPVSRQALVERAFGYDYDGALALGFPLTDAGKEALGVSVDQSGLPETRVDVMFVGHRLDAVETAGIETTAIGPTAGHMVWTKPVVASIGAMQYAPAFEVATPVDREQLFVAAVTRSLFVGVLVGGSVAVGLALAFSRGIVGPIGALTSAARRLERGDLSQRVVVDSRDEIGQLGHAFNAMADGLARNEQLRRNMVTDVAHELRTPLTNLRGYLEAIRDGVARPKPEVIQSLYEEALLLTRLVDDLQDLTLSEAGQLTLRPEPTDVRGLLHAAAHAFRQEALEKGVAVQVASVDDLPVVQADPKRVGQVLRNLLANALTYTPLGGTIGVSAERAEGAVRVSVRDAGPGIAQEHVGNIFERFYRVDPSRARATGGAGIGLAIVKQLVEAQGGAVSVATRPGHGSTFSFTLPVTD